MLHITNNLNSHHKKSFTAEVFMSMMLFAVFSSGFAQASDITADMVIKLTNKARESAKVATLKKNDLLTKAAQKKAEDMIDKNYFAHISPTGKTPWDLIESAGYDYHFAGENLAINFTNAEDEQQAWMDSELHRKNILNPNYEEIGVAVKKGIVEGKETIVTVQEFGTKMPEVVATVKPVENAQPQKVTASVAGEAVSAQPQSQTEGLQKITGKIQLSKLFQDNPKLLTVWFLAFGFALIIIVIDILAVFHKRHDRLMILRDARSRRF